MTKEQTEKLRVIGFKVSEVDSRGEIAIEKPIIPDLSSLEELISILTFGEEIKFWDAYRRSSTDPGAYVSALRLDEENVAYMDGNHGWSTRWNIVSIQEMAKRIQKNWDKDCDGGKYFNKIVISHNKYVTRERINNDLRKK